MGIIAALIEGFNGSQGGTAIPGTEGLDKK
jgi:hypothetical protein